MPNPEISKITLPNGTTYDIKDATARATAAGGIQLKGTTTTPLTDNSTTNPITIDGNSYTAVSQDAVFYGSKEFVFDGTKWHEFGDMTGLGSLATKNSATGSYTPAGSVSSSFSGTGVRLVTGNIAVPKTYEATFTGSSMTSTGSYTPAGSVTVSTATTEDKTATVSKASSGTATYTPEGSVSAPTISVATAGATTPIKPITAVGTLPTFTVADEILTITAGTLPTQGTQISVKTGDASYSASTPTFTGTGARLVTGNIAVPATYSASFSGTAASLSVSGTPEGSVDVSTKTTENKTATVTTTTGDATYTPAGSVSSSFSGTAATITVS